MTGKEGTREAAASCLVTSPCIIEAEGVDGSTKGAKEKSVASLQVCCMKLGRALLINRNLIGSNGVVHGVWDRKDYNPVNFGWKWTNI